MMVLDGNTMVLYAILSTWYFKEYHGITIVYMLETAQLA